MAPLTESQRAAKARVEASGGVFVPPSQYKAKAVKRQPMSRVASAPASKVYRQPSYTSRAATKPVRKTSAYQKLSADSAAIVDQVLDPETSTSNIVRWPNTYGVSAVYPSKNVLSAKFAANNRSAVAVYPRLRNSIFSTAGDAQDMAIADTGSPGTYTPYFIQDFSISVGETAQLSCPIYATPQYASVPYPHSSAGKMLYDFGPDILVPVTVQNNEFSAKLYFPGATNSSIQITVDRYDEFGTRIGGTVHDTDANGLAEVNLWDSLDGNPPPYSFSFELVANFTPYAGTVHGTIKSTNPASTDILWQLRNTPYTMRYESLKDSDTIISSAEKYIILGQSLLITPQMSDTKNGGTLAIGRVPGGSYVGLGSGGVTSSNWYDWIASLPTNNYDGPVKKGGYSFYLPDDERGYFYRDVSSYRDLDLPYLVSEFTVPEDAGSDPIRLKVTTLVQMTTNSSVHSLKPASICPELPRIHHILSMVNASYENESHKEQLKKHLKMIGDRVLKIVKNPTNWEKGASALAALLL